MKKFIITVFIFTAVSLFLYSKFDIDFTAGSHKNSYLLSVSGSKWKFTQSVKQKENQFTFSNSLGIKENIGPISISFYYPYNLEIEYSSESIDLSVEWTKKDSKKQTGFLRNNNSKLSEGNNILAELNVSAGDSVIKAKAGISALLREREAIKADSSITLSCYSENIEIELRKDENSQDSVRKLIVFDIAFPSIESQLSIEEGSDPVYGGTSRKYTIKQTNSFEAGGFVFETVSKADYQEDGGCITTTDFKACFSALTIKTTLSRTSGAINGFSSPEITFKTDLCRLVCSKEKFKLTLEYRTDNFSLTLNPDRTVSVEIDF